jgi:hypothetical protein
VLLISSTEIHNDRVHFNILGVIISIKKGVLISEDVERHFSDGFGHIRQQFGKTTTQKFDIFKKKENKNELKVRA